jgi:sugar (pentulose or hexulose) kinase
MSATAVLDIGKTNLKVVVFDSEGAVLWEKNAPNRPLQAPPYLHADVGNIWRFVLSALAEAARIYPIDIIVPTAHGASGVVVGPSDLVLPMLDYEDKAPEDIEPDYAKIRPPFAESLSGPAAGGLNLGRQWAFQKWRFPEEFSRARYLLTYPQYWSWRLTGVAASEVTSLGCHTDLWNPQGQRVSSLVDALGIAPLLPPIQPAWDALGCITPDVAAATGLPPATRVLNGIHDSNASLLPNLLARKAPFTVVSTGTWVIILGVGLKFETLDLASDLYANVDATGRPVPCARFMGGREFVAIAEGQTGNPDSAAIAEVIQSGAMALPSFTGNGGPYAKRRGEIRGLIADRLRTALATLHVALMTDDLLTRLGASVGDLVIEGSFGGNAAYCELLAALRPAQRVLVSADQSGTARGAALLAHWPAPPNLAPDRHAAPMHASGLATYREAWRRELGVRHT